MTGEVLDEYPMFPKLLERLARVEGRKPTCPYCHQALVSGQMIVQRTIYLPTHRKGERLVMVFFHSPCWTERDIQQHNDNEFLKKRAYGRTRQVSLLRIVNILSETGK